MKFIASCSCKAWSAYAGSEAAARALGQTHVSEAEHGTALIQHDGPHLLTVALDEVWLWVAS